MAKMSGLKKYLFKGMNKIMLDCDVATLLITKREFVKLGKLDKLRLAMHLRVCKYCRQFAKQSSIISIQISELKKIDNKNLHHHLSEKQKISIINKLEEQQLTS